MKSYKINFQWMKLKYEISELSVFVKCHIAQCNQVLLNGLQVRGQKVTAQCIFAA